MYSYHRVRKRMIYVTATLVLLLYPTAVHPKSINTTITSDDEPINNHILDFDDEYAVKFNKKYDTVPRNDKNYKDSLKYTIINDSKKINNTKEAKGKEAETTTEDYSVIPLELISTTEDTISINDSTTELDLTVIPLPTTQNNLKTDQTVTTERDVTDGVTDTTEGVTDETDADIDTTTEEAKADVSENDHRSSVNRTEISETSVTKNSNETDIKTAVNTTTALKNTTKSRFNKTHNATISEENSRNTSDSNSKEDDVPIFTELDTDNEENVPEDYYDSKDVVPTSAPKTDALSVLFGLAGSMVESVVESVAERVVPKSIYDLFKRMQKQNEALEVERLRSREENGGLGQFGRGILKSISGLTRPLTQLMAGGEAGSLDTDRGFVASAAAGVSNVANSMLDAFKDRVQAIYPGTVWCGDGRSATARSGELGLFFFTDTCCRQHDACKIYIRAGDSKYGLTNTGLFTRSHCSCDAKFRECLKRTNSLVSAQIGLTYFNVLSPQCFRRANPIVKCVKRTRITGQKCEEYELDYTKPKMWQWFDNETF